MARQIVECKRHKITLESPLKLHQASPSHCPICNSTSRSRDWDEYDSLSEKYGQPRAIFLQIDVFLREHLNKYEGSLESHIISRFKVTMHPSPYTPLTCTCSACHSTFRFHIDTPTIQSPPLYCPYCSLPTLTVHQDHELDSFEVLAQAYSTSVPLMKLLYTAFQQQKERTHFDDFITLLRTQTAQGKVNAG